ncbi:MAG: hypothetical protein MJA32_04530 [Proteobacteria bacterium]|nr:hypothetical protein [Pseudomonadota bacterium]
MQWSADRGDPVYSRGILEAHRKDLPVDYCHRHNLVDPATAGRERSFGIRVTLPPADTLRKILGDDWEQTHWYPTEAERDAAFESMAARHGYYRKTDDPTQVLEKISR